MQNLINSQVNSLNSFSSDFILFNVASKLPSNLLSSFEEIGAFVCSKEAQDLARLANKNTPNLYLYDEFANEGQFLEIHPSYHALLRRSKYVGLVSSLWENASNEKGVHYQARAIRLFLLAGLENGHLDEIIQTNAGIAALINEAELYKMLKPYLLSRQHDASEREIIKKKAISFSIVALKEEQHNFARKLNTNNDLLINNYSLMAQNCIVATPNADAFFVLAEFGGALCYFLVPKFDMHGKINNIKINHLMNSAGYRSRPLAKVNFENSVCWMIGQVGEGKKILDSLEIIRQFDQSLVAVSTMRAALNFTIACLRNNASKFTNIAKRTLADISLDVAGAQAFIFRLARAFDNSASNQNEAAFARIMAPVASYWINSLVAPVISELITHLGLEHYNENNFLVRSLQDAPVRLLNSKNIDEMVKDIISVSNRAPSLVQQIYAQITQNTPIVGGKTIEVLNAATKLAMSDESAGRFLVEQIAYSAATSSLYEFNREIIFKAFAESRLGGQWRSSYGTLNMRHNPDQILNLLYPSF